MQGPPGEERKVGETLIKMPSRKEMVSVSHVDNLILINACPTLLQLGPGAKSAPSCYGYLRNNANPA